LHRASPGDHCSARRRSERTSRRTSRTSRTSVTVILPRGKADGDPVYAAWFSLNGNGEMTGTTGIPR
jgi:L-aminopeptidase/D-esterase-like protein